MNIFEESQELLELNKYALLDPEAGINCLGSEDVLKELLELMLTEALITDKKALSVAHEHKNQQEVALIAHKIKGGALYCGTTRLIHACERLEEHSMTQQDAYSEELYEQLCVVIDETREAILQWLD